MNKIIEILECIEKNGYEAYLVGGFVRDKYLNRETYDVDICTSANAMELKNIFPNIKYNDLFCNTLKIDNYNVEITTYRIESDYDGRRPLKVEYTNNLNEDLKRRDFTINAICLDKNNNIIDLYDGMTDLKNKLIRCIGDSDKKISEDALRVLRAVRFATILNFNLDLDLEKAIYKYASNIKNLSSFRKKDELDKILKSKNFEYGINLIRKFNLDKSLNISFPKMMNYCEDIMGMYLQIDNIDKYLNEKEKKKYNYLKQYFDKELNNYDLYILGKDNLFILNKEYLNSYDKLVIKRDSDLDIDIQFLINLANTKNLNINDLKSDIIKNILDEKIKNDYDGIISFIDNNY